MTMPSTQQNLDSNSSLEALVKSSEGEKFKASGFTVEIKNLSGVIIVREFIVSDESCLEVSKCLKAASDLTLLNRLSMHSMLAKKLEKRISGGES
jgi:hypothetical protein